MKYLKIITLIVFLAVAGFFAWQQLRDIGPADADLEALRQSILTEPVVQRDDIPDDLRERFAQQFRESSQRLVENDFGILQDINRIGFIKHSVGDFEGAIDAYAYGNITQPLNSLTFANLAALYHFDLQNFEKAEENYLISIANDPDDIHTIRNFYTLYHSGTANHAPDDRKAEALLLQAIDDNPETADLYSLAGSFYKDIGERDKAIEMFERHLELNPGNKAVEQELERLRQNQQ